jgi:hypothetical protein
MKLSKVMDIVTLSKSMIDFMQARPAYIPLLSLPKTYRRDPVARNRLRELFADLFREKRPDLSKDDAFRIANVAMQLVKGMNPLYAEAKAGEREEIVREFKMVLTGYLNARLVQRGQREGWRGRPEVAVRWEGRVPDGRPLEAMVYQLVGGLRSGRGISGAGRLRSCRSGRAMCMMW